MLFLNLLSFEMHVLSVRAEGRAPSAQCQSPVAGAVHVQAACRGPDPLIQRYVMEIDFSYLSPEMNSVLNWNKFCS